MSDAGYEREKVRIESAHLGVFVGISGSETWLPHYRFFKGQAALPAFCRALALPTYNESPLNLQTILPLNPRPLLHTLKP